MVKSDDDMKWETKCCIYLSISYILRGDLPRLPLDIIILVCKTHQEHVSKKHKEVNIQWLQSSLFSLCLCLLSKDNLSFQFLSSSIQPRGAIPLWDKIFLNFFFLSSFFFFYFNPYIPMQLFNIHPLIVCIWDMNIIVCYFLITGKI